MIVVGILLVELEYQKVHHLMIEWQTKPVICLNYRLGLGWRRRVERGRTGIAHGRCGLDLKGCETPNMDFIFEDLVYVKAGAIPDVYYLTAGRAPDMDSVEVKRVSGIGWRCWATSSDPDCRF